jgi:hypothetical protein
MAGLANASARHPRDLGLNLGIDRNYYVVLIVSGLNLNLLGINICVY